MASAFLMAFSAKALSPPMESTTLPSIAPEELVNSLSCLFRSWIMLQFFKMRNQRVNEQPWLNDVTRNVCLHA